MTRIEEQLQLTFQSAVADPPIRPDPADLAIGRAGRIRRRRGFTMVGSAAAVLGVVLGAGVLLTDGPPPAPTITPATPGGHTVSESPSSPQPRSTSLTLAVRSGNRLSGPDLDVRVPLDLENGFVIPVRGGWVYNNASKGGVHTISFFNREGVVRKLADGENLVVGPDGQKLAWTRGGKLTAARIDASGQLHDERTTPVPATVVAVTWAGDRIVLTRPRACCGGGDPEGGSSAAPTWDTWDPSAGPFVPRWPMVGGAVYGPSKPEGDELVAVVPASAPTDGAGCLALLDPATLSVRQKRCDLGLASEDWLASLSPSGQRFFTVTGKDKAQIIDVHAAFAGKSVAETVQVATGYVEGAKWDGNIAVIRIGGPLYEWGPDGTRSRLDELFEMWRVVGDSYVRG